MRVAFLSSSLASSRGSLFPVLILCSPRPARRPSEASAFSAKVDEVFQLARKEAIASGIFFGGTGLTGNLTMLCLLGYGGHLVASRVPLAGVCRSLSTEGGDAGQGGALLSLLFPWSVSF